MAKIIDGKKIREYNLDKIAERVSVLKEKGVLPTLAVIIVGSDPASRIYVNNKKAACERTGMRYVCNHSFRHFNASVLISNGIDVKTVQSCLGHSTATTTANTYSHLDYSSKIMSAETMEKILGVV